ncbi:MAG: LysM peptidoglycan-binding domain-containing protein [Mycobacterium sp.]
MTVLDDRQLTDWYAVWPAVDANLRRPVRARVQRPGPARPAVAALHYRGTGVTRSHTAHGRRPVSTSITIALAGLAALITLWLGSLAQFSSERVSAPAALPDQLAVVQVQAGETLQQLAGRVAPDAPAARIVERIRDLNKLDSSAVDAGQTLIAPVS